MPHPNDQRDEAIKRLDEGLDAFDKKRARPSTLGGDAGSMGEGYRLLAGLIGGVLGGLGLGWTVDYFAHTSPFGLVGGLLIGIVLSTYAAVRTAGRMSAEAVAKSGPAPAVPDDDDDD
jgi:ATP synthase protein I